MEKVSLETLIEAAADARANAVAPYSGLLVGAAIEDSEGRVWTGVNVESSSYGLSVCAERIALFKALSEGASGFRRLAVAATGEGVVMPCGACRQVLHDHAEGIEITLYDPDTCETRTLKLGELYPHPFGDRNLRGGRSG